MIKNEQGLIGGIVSGPTDELKAYEQGYRDGHAAAWHLATEAASGPNKERLDRFALVRVLPEYKPGVKYYPLQLASIAAKTAQALVAELDGVKP